MESARSDTPTNMSPDVKFGSQLVDKNSMTPYSDATQVGTINTLAGSKSNFLFQHADVFKLDSNNCDQLVSKQRDQLLRCLAFSRPPDSYRE